MLRAALFRVSLVASFLIAVLAIQVSLGSSHRWQALLGDITDLDWDLDKLPNPNDTNHLVFETVHSLLQHWPNTRMRNGHNIVPGVVPKGTLLYHSTGHSQLPSRPDWVATDPEHSYTLCVDRLIQHASCWLHAIATTRPLKVIYFDGTSAANMRTGTADTQELIAWGSIHTGSIKEERKLLQDLCQWGKKFDVDGFVRMEMSFEIMLCDFTSGSSLVSSSNVPSRGAIRTRGLITFEVIDAGSWHNHFPGETRIQLDLAGLISFYDTQLVPSLVPIRASQERWDHRAGNISSGDLSAVKSRLEAVLVRSPGLSSGIDWRTLVQVIVDRFAGRLELTRHLLNPSATHPDEILDLASKTQTQLRIMLTPYLLLSTAPTDKADLEWTKPVFKLCATTHTHTMESELDSMTNSEKLLLRSIRGTSREICRVLTRMWAAGVYAGIDPSLDTKESPDIAEVTQVWETWGKDLNRLMAWLDWSVWVKCIPRCGPEELCYLPTWPIGLPVEWGGHRRRPFPSNPDRSYPGRLTNSDMRTMALENLAEEMWDTIRPQPDEWWIRPQPKCIRRVAPQGF